MFKSTRNHLTVLYTLIISAFLMLFIAITSFLLSYLVGNDQKKELIRFVNIEIEAHKPELKIWYNEKREEPLGIGYKPHRTMFYFFYSHDHNLIHGNETRPELRDKIINLIPDIPTDGEHVVKHEIKDLDGEILTLALLGKNVYSNDKLIGTIYAGTNITKQKKIFNQLSLILSILAIIFIIGTTIIAHYMAGKAMKPIEDAFMRKKTFVADASHELRTPISVLQSSVYVIDYHDREKLTPFSKQTLDNMKNEIKRMSFLIEDLLTIARQDYGHDQMNENKETFSLTDEAKHVLDQVKTVADKKDVALHSNIEDCISLFGDREQLFRLMYILIDNAIKFSNEKGAVTLSLYKQKNMVVLQVSDTGIGISKEDQGKIFDRFYRADQGRSRGIGGTGLGLSIASRIVQSHNGEITVSSEIGKGTTFQIEFPSTNQT